MNQPDMKSRTRRRYTVIGLLVLLGCLFAYYTGDQASSVGSSASFTIDTRDADSDVRGASLLASKESSFFTIDTLDSDVVVRALSLASSATSGFFTIDTLDPDAAVFAVSQVTSKWSGFFTIDTMADSSTRAESGYFTIDTMDPDVLARGVSLVASDESGWFTINTLEPPPEDNDADKLHDLWETIHFGGILASGANDDPDGDGRTNFEEFAFGTDPMVLDAPARVALTIENDSSGARLVLRHTKHILALGMVNYSYETSTDSRVWIDSTANWHEVMEPQNLDGYVEWVTLTYDLPTLPRSMFVRVRVTPKP